MQTWAPVQISFATDTVVNVAMIECYVCRVTRVDYIFGVFFTLGLIRLNCLGLHGRTVVSTVALQQDISMLNQFACSFSCTLNLLSAHLDTGFLQDSKTINVGLIATLGVSVTIIVHECLCEQNMQ